jgi:hypothetical protein
VKERALFANIAEKIIIIDENKQIAPQARIYRKVLQNFKKIIVSPSFLVGAGRVIV